MAAATYASLLNVAYSFLTKEITLVIDYELFSLREYRESLNLKRPARIVSTLVWESLADGREGFSISSILASQSAFA